MRKKPVKLPEEYYFSSEIVPCAVVKVHGNALSHEHNYTGIPHWHDFSELVIITAGTSVLIRSKFHDMPGSCVRTFPASSSDAASGSGLRISPPGELTAVWSA